MCPHYRSYCWFWLYLHCYSPPSQEITLDKMVQIGLALDPDLPWTPLLHLKQGYLYVCGFLPNSKCLK